jgi:small subunit ribosomal protein S4
MARYTGPLCRLCRRQGMKLFLKGERCFTPKCAVERRPTPPGDHGQRRRKISEYGEHLKEKQKVRAIYGVLERQFSKHFDQAKRQPGATGENLLRILESRLDNVVFRLGLADNRNQARQIVTHGHIRLNGRKTDVPSALVRQGDTISVEPRSKDKEYFKIVADTLEKKSVPRWLELNAAELSGRVLSAPSREDLETNVNEQLIVEYYSR